MAETHKSSPDQSSGSERLQAIRAVIETRLRDPKTPFEDLPRLQAEIARLKAQEKGLLEGPTSIMPIEADENSDYISSETIALLDKLRDRDTTLEELEAIKMGINQLPPQAS